MLLGFLVLDPIAIRGVTSQITTLKIALQVIAGKPEGNDNLRRIAIAAEPIGISSANGGG